jgi:phage terminase large subunit-like protein
MAYGTIAPDPFAVAADIVDPPAWEAKGRPALEKHQVPPPGKPGKDWKFWLLEAGRGAGKTEACARFYCKMMRENPGWRGRILAPTFGDAVEACVRGPSGVLNQDPEVKWVPGAEGGSKLFWPNGSEALVLGLHTENDVDRLRAGGNRHLDWWEECAAIRHLKQGWDQAAAGLRLGDYPFSIGSTTPRSTKAYKALRKLKGIILRKATLFDNPHNPDSFVTLMKERYQGTRLYEQEILGNMLEDIAGALWRRIVLESVQIDASAGLPDMVEVVVAVDPAATSSEDADDTGIVVVGLGTDGLAYVLEDRTCHLDPDGWGSEAVAAYNKWDADLIIGEVNNGGEMVEHVISTIDHRVPFKAVRASRGKAVRAQPVASLYGNPESDPVREAMVRHVGNFPELEDQMCTWVPGEEDSPDNMDALVWGLTHIFLEDRDDEETYEEDWEPVQIGADV